MRTLRLWIAYDGTAYAGWQRQAGADTIQELVERALASLVGTEVTLHGAGRTDAGVHAFAQSAHVKIERGPPTDRIHLALNTLLPRDIRVLGAIDVDSDFHARFSARGKRYAYSIRTDPVPFPLGRRYFHWHPGGALDAAAMRRAAQFLRGKHDFAAFGSNPGVERTRPTVRSVQSLVLRERPSGVALVIQGDGFLYNMVRAIAGTLLEVGKGKQSPEWVAEVLEGRDRKFAGPTLPPEGLALVRVLYDRRYGPIAAPGFRR